MCAQGAGLTKAFDLAEDRLANYLQKVETGYNANPYHSRTHAAGVLQSMHMLAQNGLIQEGVLDETLQLACYMAGQCSAILHIC